MLSLDASCLLLDDVTLRPQWTENELPF